MSAENAALVRRWFDEVWNDRKDSLIDDLIDDESVCIVDDGPMRGAAEFRQRQYAPFLAAFPDLKVEVEAVLADRDEVAVRWSATGTHTGDGLGFPATNRRAAFRGMSWIHVRDGRLREGWQSSNIAEVVRGLAAGPE